VAPAPPPDTGKKTVGAFKFIPHEALKIRVGKAAFNSSTLLGRKIMEAAAKSSVNLKLATPGLGGKSLSVTFDDADLGQLLVPGCA